MMPLSKSALAQQLEQLIRNRPPTVADAAAAWANAYVGYAASAISAAASLPLNATGNFGILLGGFQGGLAALTPAGAAALIAQGVSAFWQAIAWTGPLAAGTTTVPGNTALAATLSAIFADLGNSTPAEKANRIADAFDLGARAVIVTDVPFVQPAPPIVAPIQ
jgi:hypothetical protein